MRCANVRLWFFRFTRSSVTYRNSQLSHFGRTISSRSVESKPDPKVLALRDKLLYCDYLDHEKIAYQPVYSVTIGDGEEQGTKVDDNDTHESVTKEKPLHMPYAMVDKYDSTTIDDSIVDDVDESLLNEKYKSIYEKYLEIKMSGPSNITRAEFQDFLEKDESNVLKNAPEGELWKVPHTWMHDYEQFDDNLIDVDWYKNYGTPNPDSEVSSFPCGGCGALLHCKDPAIPGYLPSEIFLSTKDDELLKSTICQRCHFLKFYNAALNVKVSIEDYPKLLQVIKRKKCAIILMIDLTDFPCSIWPHLKSIMHPFTPIFLVGNKVDLLPRDSPFFIEKVRKLLLETVIDVTGVNRANITHVQLVSAKTGYGIEQLINKLQHIWRYKGDVYLVGCTNVGKSSLFNALLNSDYCKVQAVDLVQRATVSAWPGTTLNLLKFPILNPNGKKLLLRIARLRNDNVENMLEMKYRNYQFKETRNMRFATLQASVGRSFTGRSLEEISSDPFSQKPHSFMLKKPVLDESEPEYSQSRWCYDTPGTIQRDQILDLLTTDELMLTLPQQIISPRTFILKSKQSVFVAGMGRLDYLKGEYYIRCTLFASRELPITICYTAYADQVYEQLLDSEAFVVPANDSERLKVWPKLESKELEVVTGVRGESVADVVLSSIGWIAVTPYVNETASLKAWTPQGRGIYLRRPALLSKSVCLHGVRVAGTPMYRFGKQVYIEN
ncbi:Nitric oxide-associated protein 1 [Anthophora plagiata]